MDDILLISTWKSMDIHGYPWISMEIHGNPWESMDIHGDPWISMEMHGYPWKSLEIRGKFQRALKLAENRENELFTFFGFLPPYIDVSGSLVSRKR